MRLTRRGRILARVGAGVLAVTAATVGALLPTNGEAKSANNAIVAEQAKSAERAAHADDLQAFVEEIIQESRSMDANVIGRSEVGQGGSAEATIVELIPEDAEQSEDQAAVTDISAKAVDEYYEELHGGALQPTDEVAVLQVEHDGETLYVGTPVEK